EPSWWSNRAGAPDWRVRCTHYRNLGSPDAGFASRFPRRRWHLRWWRPGYCSGAAFAVTSPSPKVQPAISRAALLRFLMPQWLARYVVDQQLRIHLDIASIGHARVAFTGKRSHHRADQGAMAHYQHL